MYFKSCYLAVALATSALFVFPASANSLTFQGVTFNTLAVDSDTLQLSILNANAATGNWTGVNYIKAFEIKEIGGPVTAASIVSGPGSFAATVSHGLNANAGCTSGNTPGACFTGAPIALTASMVWTIDFTGPNLDFSAPHLKIQFFTNVNDSNATGDLLSQTIPFGPNPNAVPEPESYALMLAGLGLVGFSACRRKQSVSA